MQPKCLSIAGFDGSGGAGMQADLKTFTVLGCYGMNVLTALPVQNTQGVKSCYKIPIEVIEAQLQAIFDDITPDCIKIGMLFNQEIIELVAWFLEKRALGTPIVLDPVMVAKSGHPLLLPEAVGILKLKLFPLATIITPNLPEAEELTKTNGDRKLVKDSVLQDDAVRRTGVYTSVPNEDSSTASTQQDDSLVAFPKRSIELLAEQLLHAGTHAVLLKGGHLGGTQSNDFYLDNKQHLWLTSPRLISNNTHGTGCTLSAAIAAYLAFGIPLLDACQYGKRFLFSAIKAAQNTPIGKGHGPVNHLHGLSDDGRYT